MKKRILAILLVVVLAGGAFLIGRSGMEVRQVEEEAVEEVSSSNQKDTMYLWYTDDKLTDYLSSVAVAFNETRDDVRVVPVLQSGREYLETISQASVENVEMPDLFIAGNDTLEKAYLAGLSSPILASEEELSALFPDTAIRAVSAEGKTMGYPFYFETATMIYNSTYMNEWAKTTVQAQMDQEEGEAAQLEAEANTPAEVAQEVKTEESADSKSEDSEKKDNKEGTKETTESASEETEEVVEEENTDPVFLARVEELLAQSKPDTFDELLSFADEYDAPEQMEGLLKWDVTDIFYTYFFLGDAINVGGENGDDTNLIDFYNERAIRGMMLYQDLHQFFSIETDEISYDGVIQDFLDGKILYMIATSDAVEDIEAAKAEGTFAFDYELCPLPAVMEDYPARSLSVTNAVVINGYSLQKEAANDFAKFLVTQDGQALYSRTSKLSALREVGYENPKLSGFMAEYEKSEPVAKMLETSNYWIKLEIAFADIWDGKDANVTLRNLAQELLTQVTNEDVILDEIVVETEEVVEEEVEENLSDEGEGE